MARKPALALADRPLEEEEVEAAIFVHEGNVTKAAEELQVRSDRLRKFILAKPVLRKAMDEILDRGVDEALGVLFEGLRQENWFARLAAAKEFLRTEASVRRGIKPIPTAVQVQAPAGGSGALVLKWLDDEGPKLIEGSVNNGSR